MQIIGSGPLVFNRIPLTFTSLVFPMFAVENLHHWIERYSWNFREVRLMDLITFCLLRIRSFRAIYFFRVSLPRSRWERLHCGHRFRVSDHLSHKGGVRAKPRSPGNSRSKRETRYTRISGTQRGQWIRVSVIPLLLSPVVFAVCAGCSTSISC